MSDTELVGSVEAEVWDLFDADQGVADETVYLVAAALQGDHELAAQLGGDAPVPQRPAVQVPAGPAPLRAFLRSITVEGFRGIGPKATLDLNPYCGLTVISGRNGSGKSSFAEALEYALTGASYRWLNKRGQHWEASWRNLHAGERTSIVVDFAMEPDGERGGHTALVGVDWAPDANLNQAKRWSQITGQKRASIDALGWDQALVTHRPIMSYAEIGGLLEEGQAALYDALNRLLGLDEVADAENRLKDAEENWADHARRPTTLGRAFARAWKPRRIHAPRSSSDSPRAFRTTSTESRQPPSAPRPARPPPSHDCGLWPQSRDPTLPGLPPSRTNCARPSMRMQTLPVLPGKRWRHGLACCVKHWSCTRTSATAHALCARPERLTPHGVASPRRGSLQLMPKPPSTKRRHDASNRRGRRPKASPANWIQLPSVDGIDLAALSPFNEAVAQARSVPESLTDLPAHIETAAAALAASADALRIEASERAAALEDAWAPTAQEIVGWVELENAARSDDERLRRVQAALKWLRDNAVELRKRRLAPMVDQAREIWGRMRHESNVDLGGITLEGAANRRKAVVEGSVDGVPAGALSVMSQGELHALALALFLPRATTPASPFRFLILDDPIQAMDPAKIEGFLTVLVELAKTRQVVVFSHDDRLPAAIRARSIPAQLLDVTREEGSLVVVRENDLPAHRHIADLTALILDERLDDVVKRKAAPGLFRMAVEAAAHQRFFTDQARAGAAYHESDAAWEDAKTTQQCVALAITGAASNDIAGWKSYRAHRFPTLAICATGAHRGAALDHSTIHDLRETVCDIVENR